MVGEDQVLQVPTHHTWDLDKKDFISSLMEGMIVMVMMRIMISPHTHKHTLF